MVQYRLQLPLPLVRAVVWMCTMWGIAGVCAIFLAFQVSNTLKHGDAAVATVATGVATAIDRQFEAAEGSYWTTSARLGQSLDNLDRQVSSVGPVVRKLGPVADNLAAIEAKAGESIDRVNAPCAPGPCGTIADIGKTLNTVRGTFGQIEVAANHEDKNLTTLDTQENQLFLDFHGTATRMNTGLDNFDGLLADPNLALTMKNVGSMTTTADQVEKKLAQCTLHPTAICYFKNDAIFAAQVGGYLLR